MAFIGMFVYLAHFIILLQLYPFGLGVDGKGRWFEHFVW